MNWNEIVQKLKENGEVTTRVSGGSMTPRIRSGETITITSDLGEIRKGDIVFCKVQGRYFVHLVSAVKNDQVQISNNHGHVNGWTPRDKIFGRVVHK
jgi:phage repressor protein C with HTH and peptisase S24 domain